MSEYGHPSTEYLSGFFDGEGCINITRDSKQYKPRLAVLFANNDRELLEAIQGHWGGAIYKQSSNRGPLNERRQSWVLHFNSTADQLRFLKAVELSLRIKRKQALNAIEFLEIKQQVRALGRRETPDWALERLEHCHAIAHILSSRNYEDVVLPDLPEDDEEVEQIEMEVLDA